MTESSEVPSQYTQAEAPHEISPLRFRATMEANVRSSVREVRSSGLASLEMIPRGVTPVIAASHVRSDIDLQIVASELDHHRNVGVSLFSTNREFPVTNVGMTIAGQDRFFDVDVKEDKSNSEGGVVVSRNFKFNPENYEVMKEAMEKKGIWPIVAAHEAPIYTGILPNKSGFAVPYLAQLTEVPCVLPVVGDIDTPVDNPVGRIDHLGHIIKNIRNRPDATVTVCDPIFLEKLPDEDIADMTKWIMAITNRQQSGLAPERKAIAKQTYRKLREQGDAVMMALAEKLPEERRGVWGDRLRLRQAEQQ